MTREQKLALIVGFSLVLLVGVLISDHLSRARQAKIASVAPTETPQLPVTSAASDPLNVLNVALNTPAPANPVRSSPPAGQPVTASSNPSPIEPAPTTVAQGPSHSAAGGDSTALEDAVRNAGGVIRVGANGVSDIVLPETAKTVVASTANPTQAMPNTSTSPLYGYPASAKNLGTNEQFKTHTVQKGETLFQIAGKYYGTGHVWRDLARYNNVSNKDGSVRVGSRLKIPSKDVLLGKAAPGTQTAGRDATPAVPAAKSTPGHRQEVVKPEIKLATYTVKKGETLGEISQKVLGSSKRWEELAEFNKLQDEDSIAAGTVLKLPPMRG